MVKSRVKLAKFLPDNWTVVYISHRDVTMSFDLWFTRNGLGMITSAENAQIIPMARVTFAWVALSGGTRRRSIMCCPLN